MEFHQNLVPVLPIPHIDVLNELVRAVRNRIPKGQLPSKAQEYLLGRLTMLKFQTNVVSVDAEPVVEPQASTQAPDNIIQFPTTTNNQAQ